jgi:hypothetical protein
MPSLWICGSAREFGETGNWRRVELFALPEISGTGTEMGTDESEIANLPSPAISESVET